MKYKKKEKPKYKKKEKKPVTYDKPKGLARRVVRKKDGFPRCFICHKKLDDLIDLRQMKMNGWEGSDEYNKMKNRVTERIVRLPQSDKEGTLPPLYRHADCEPGSSKYNNSKVGEGYHERHNLT